MVGIIDAPLKVELAVGDGKTPLAHHRRHRHVHQLPVVETGTIQVQLPEQKLFKIQATITHQALSRLAT